MRKLRLRNADLDSAKGVHDLLRDAGNRVPRAFNRVLDETPDAVENALHLRAKAGESQLVADAVSDANRRALGSVKLRAYVVLDRVERVCRLALRRLPIAVHRGLQSSSRRASDGLSRVHVVLNRGSDLPECRIGVAG